MKRAILVLVFLALMLAGCGPVLSDTSTHSYQGDTTHIANSETANGFQTADQAQNDNQPRCVGLFVIGSCNVSQTNIQTITTARTQQEAASADMPSSAEAASYEGVGWTILIIIGALCWLFVGYKLLSGGLAQGYN